MHRGQRIAGYLQTLTELDELDIGGSADRKLRVRLNLEIDLDA